MNKKIVGILVCMLLIAAAVLPAAGIMTIGNTKPAESSFGSDATLEREISEPDDPAPEPAATKTGYLSIPAAAFTPRKKDTYFENDGHHITGEGLFVAPVYLPHGATVTKLTHYWINEADACAPLHLYRSYMDGNTDEMANAWIEGGVHGNGVSWTDSIDYPEIDNTLYSYFLVLGLGYDMGCYSVIIEYTYKK